MNRMTVEKKKFRPIKWNNVEMHFEDFANNKKLGYAFVAGIGLIIILLEFSLRIFM